MFIKISHHHLLVESIGSFEHAFTNLEQKNLKTIPKNIADGTTRQAKLFLLYLLFPKSPSIFRPGIAILLSKIFDERPFFKPVEYFLVLVIFEIQSQVLDFNR
jgi:hypothetical protein